jgi:hypothetical protein
MFTYKLNSVGCSSSRVGNCEVCNTYVSDVFIQSKFKKFIYGGVDRFSLVSQIFGHRQCLEKIRK